MTKLALCLLQCLATLLRTSLKDQLLADLAESKQHLNCIISWSLSRAWPVITNSLLRDQRSASVHALRLYNYWHEAFLKDWQTKSHLCIFFQTSIDSLAALRRIQNTPFKVCSVSHRLTQLITSTPP